jgi:hypothetical protein
VALCITEQIFIFILFWIFCLVGNLLEVGWKEIYSDIKFDVGQTRKLTIKLKNRSRHQAIGINPRRNFLFIKIYSTCP